jgi:hypothetical protein
MHKKVQGLSISALDHELIELVTTFHTYPSMENDQE